ncbi:MAG TPA: molybdopterin molybdotransferase MoeA [Syntrophorhabdaceae bacterium]|nr:molybdopterin molybdotransferase MoeA [Syntrophorhabdaceae bacterium]
MDFLKSVSTKDACIILKNFNIQLDIECIKIDNAYNRVIAQDILSKEDVPYFSRSLVDGYAIKAKDTYGAKETSPRFLNVIGEVKIGEITDLKIDDGECVRVSTGSMIPEGSDGVIMQEYVREMLDSIEITRVVRRGENICFKADDIKKDEKVVERGKRLDFFDMGILASLGISKVDVYKKPQVGIISTGDEIVDIIETPKPGQIRDINRYVITGLLAREGFSVKSSGIARDNLKEIEEKIIQVMNTDLILISGGSSKGERDYIVEAIEKLGGEIIFHGINIKPGKPTIFAKLKDKPVFGLPGHPASCTIVALRFVIPFLKKMEGQESFLPESAYMGVLTSNVPSSLGIEEYVEITAEKRYDKILVTPLFSKSSLISTFTKAKGYIIVPEDKEGLEKEEIVEVYTF